ncbi:hypothetical protein L207DRAFT_263481 [Hyaloscypha variabilis F]|uniref:Zn(2)-C6 fungal-type domain-containing protein n=1 Tax=Hyaloscypha variabilis (strain UAMH 11265 / GT02V1 / F) TaxID=1149755 RepID=A0A2J6QS58_HYAVF|nr:hypothetical protein L207DRAFT_263481 [Hyaloscypha variabilis F]
MDGRRRDGCFTCKQRKKKCDCSYSVVATTGSQTCSTCKHHGITCYVTEPDWFNDSERRKAHLEEQKRRLRLKRKSRDESVSSGRTSRDRSATIRPTELSMHQSSVLRSIENEFSEHHTGSMNRPPAHPRKGMAIRGGRGGRGRPRQ